MGFNDGGGGFFDNGGGITVSVKEISVPEPLTMLGSVTALGFGAFFKRKLKSSKPSEKVS